MSQIYLAVVTGNTLAESKNNQTPSVEVQVRTSKNLTTGEDVAKTLTGNLWMTPKAIDHTVATLAETFGWAGESLKELNMPILAGIEVEVVTEDDSYQGRSYEKVTFFNRPGSSSARKLTPADESLARTVAAQYDSALRGFKAKGGKPAEVKRCGTLEMARSNAQSASAPAPGGFESESGYTPPENESLPWE